MSTRTTKEPYLYIELSDSRSWVDRIWTGEAGHFRSCICVDRRRRRDALAHLRTSEIGRVLHPVARDRGATQPPRSPALADVLSPVSRAPGHIGRASSDLVPHHRASCQVTRAAPRSGSPSKSD